MQQEQQTIFQYVRFHRHSYGCLRCRAARSCCDAEYHTIQFHIRLIPRWYNEKPIFFDKCIYGPFVQLVLLQPYTCARRRRLQNNSGSWTGPGHVSVAHSLISAMRTPPLNSVFSAHKFPQRTHFISAGRAGSRRTIQNP